MFFQIYGKIKLIHAKFSRDMTVREINKQSSSDGTWFGDQPDGKNIFFIRVCIRCIICHLAKQCNWLCLAGS